MTPREFFPNMPDEVFEMWIEPMIDSKGWPFTESNLSTVGTKWFHVFGFEYPLTYWRAIKWSLVELEIFTEKVNDNTHAVFHCIALHGITGRYTTVTAGLTDSQLRFRACAEFIKDKGILPKPIIAIREKNGSLKIIDGNHRISAYILINKTNQLSGIVKAWMPVE